MSRPWAVSSLTAPCAFLCRNMCGRAGGPKELEHAVERCGPDTPQPTLRRSRLRHRRPVEWVSQKTARKFGGLSAEYSASMFIYGLDKYTAMGAKAFVSVLGVCRGLKEQTRGYRFTNSGTFLMSGRWPSKDAEAPHRNLASGTALMKSGGEGH